MMMVLLDWEKTFDRVERKELMKSRQGMGVAEKNIKIIKMLYRKTDFMVEIYGVSSHWETKQTESDRGAHCHHIYFELP